MPVRFWPASFIITTSAKMNALLLSHYHHHNILNIQKDVNLMVLNLNNKSSQIRLIPTPLTLVVTKNIHSTHDTGFKI